MKSALNDLPLGNAGLGERGPLTNGPKADTSLQKRGADLTRGPNASFKLPAAAWASTWPAPQATLDLDFVNNRGWVRGVGQGGVMDAITFTRASTGAYVGSDGLLKTAANGVWRQDWGSTAQTAQVNLLTYTALTGGTAGTEGSGAVAPTGWTFGVSTGSISYPAALTGGGTAARFVASAQRPYFQQGVTLAANTTYTFSAYVDAVASGSSVVTDNISYNSVPSGTTVTYYVNGVLVTGNTTVVTAGTRLSAVFTVGATGGAINLRFGLGGSGNATGDVTLSAPQFQIGSTATTYQQIGSAVPTNTPLAANPTSNGILIEESRTNLILWCRDATQSGGSQPWTTTNCTTALDQTGIDGVANAASRLTATSANASCKQTVTRASGSATGSVYLKRIGTLTGNVQVTLDGSTWSTVDLSNGLWNRIVLSGTVTNPCVGVLIANSGDAVAMDFGQVEAAAFATSPIMTTTSTATRSADVASAAATAAWYNAGSQTVNATIRFTNYVSGTGFTGGIVGFGGSAPRVFLQRGSGVDRPYSAQIYDGTRVNSANGPNSNDSANGVSHSICLTYTNSTMQLSVDGAAGTANTVSYVGAPVATNTMVIGNRPDTNSYLNGWLARLTVFPKLVNTTVINTIAGPAT